MNLEAKPEAVLRSAPGRGLILRRLQKSFEIEECTRSTGVVGPEPIQSKRPRAWWLVLLWLSGDAFAPGLWADIRLTNCSEAELRAAIARGGRIVFDCDGTVGLSQTLVVTTDVSVDA